jgi:hypothetical protein
MSKSELFLKLFMKSDFKSILSSASIEEGILGIFSLPQILTVGFDGWLRSILMMS